MCYGLLTLRVSIIIGMKDEDIPDDCPFVCADCWNGIQRCFKCKYFDVEEDLVKCEVPYCGKFYHSKVYCEQI